MPWIPRLNRPEAAWNLAVRLSRLKTLPSVIDIIDYLTVDIIIMIDEARWRSMSEQEAMETIWQLRNLMKAVIRSGNRRVRVVNEDHEVFLAHEQLELLVDFPRERPGMPLPPDPALDLM